VRVRESASRWTATGSSDPYSVRMQANRPGRVDLAVAAVLVCLALVEAVTEPVDGHRLLAMVAFVLPAAALAWRVTAPMVPVLVTSILIPLQTAAGLPLNTALTTTVVIVVTAYSAGAHLEPRRSALAAALLLAAATASVLLGHRPVWSNLPFALLVVGGSLGGGAAMRARQRHAESLSAQRDLLREHADWLEQRSAEEAAAAVSAERARIARELHDLVSHSLTVIGLQAGGVRRLLNDDQSEERQALLLVERTSRQAQDEMRHLLTLLRSANDELSLAPQPGLARVGELLADARASGVATDYQVRGERVELPVGVDLAAYRIVQEALTNVRKHSDADRVAVTIDQRPGTVQIEVCDNGSLTSTGEPGFGLVGMRERAALYGGSLEAGPGPHGGFRVFASLSYRPEPAA
jgi:signal transduction histidine kinase